MTIEPWTLYWVIMLDKVSVLFTVLTVAFLVCTPFIWGVVCSEIHEGNLSKRYLWHPIIATLIGCISSVMLIITPTTKQMATILVLPKVVNSEFVQEDLPKEGKEIYELMKKYLIKQVGDEK